MSAASTIGPSSPDAGGFTIAELSSLAEIEEWQAVDSAVWPGSSLETVPLHLLVTHQRYGGLLLGARDQERRMIGILLGFPGLKDGKVVHCSHLLGVLPEWRARDVGFHMKCRQRDFVLGQGLDQVVWTFDPLETRNARLNVGRLGAIAYEYTPNLYGVGRDALNEGLETDRFTVAWHIRHPRVVERLAGRMPAPQPAALLAAGVPLLTLGTPRIPSTTGGTTYLRLEDIVLGANAPLLLVEAPSNFQQIKRVDPEAAHGWRHGLRALFLDLLARGYGVLHLLREQDTQPLRCYYLVGPIEEYLAGTLSWDSYAAGPAAR